MAARNIGVVPQESLLFNESVRANLTYGRQTRGLLPVGPLIAEPAPSEVKGAA